MFPRLRCGRLPATLSLCVAKYFATPDYLVDQPVNATILDSGDREPFQGTVVDLSASGLGVRVPYPIDLGCSIEIRWSRGTVIAQVRNCLQMSPYNYRVRLKTSKMLERSEMEAQIGVACNKGFVESGSCSLRAGKLSTK